MAALNHIVGALVSPLPLGLLALAAAFTLAFAFRRGRAGAVLAAIAAVWTWLWSTPLMTAAVARPLERAFTPRPAAEYPQADAVVLLGGGMNYCEDGGVGAEMWTSADRVWQAARLYRAGRAPKVICTGCMTALSTAPLLRDLGVPDDAVVCIEEPRNTEEEGRAVAAGLGGRGAGRPVRILLVTSSWHMRRALQMFSRAAGADAEIVPAPCDCEATAKLAEGFDASWFWPTADALNTNSVAFKERFAFWAYRLLRGF